MWNLVKLENFYLFEKWFNHNDNDQLIHNYYGLNSIEIEMRIDEIIKWSQQHPTLPQACQDRHFIECILRHNKYDVQRTIKKIGIYFETIRKYGNNFKNLKRFQQFNENIIFISMPVITKDLERIILFKINNRSNSINIDIERVILTIAPVALLNFHYGNYLKARVIVDYNHITLQQCQSVSPITITKLLRIAEGITSTHIAGIELMNCPNYIGAILTLLKTIVKPKLLAKFNNHQNLESLHQIIPKQYLPYDYGGNLDTLDHLLEEFDEILDNSQEFIDKIKSFIPPTSVRNDIFGADGNFRHLDID